MTTNVYHSISPYGTGNILSGGSPTIIVDSNGDAIITLGGASFLFDNIGQGTKVVYNGITSYIDSIIDTTHFHLIDADGANAAEQSSTDVTSIGYEYASLSDAEAGLQQDLTSSDLVMNITCYYDPDDYTADTTAITITGWTTDATRYIKVYTLIGGTQSINSQRHDGKWDTEKYRISTNSAGSEITISQNYVYIIGLQVEETGNPASHSMLFCNGADYVYIWQNIIRKTGGDYHIHYGISLTGAYAKNIYIYNNIIYHMLYGVRDYTDYDIGDYVIAYNNTIYDVTYGFSVGGSNARFLVANNIVRAVGTDGYQGIFNADSDYNSSNISGDAPVKSPRDNTQSPWYSGAIADASIFTNVTLNSEDFHLISDAIFINVGVDLSGIFTIDIDDQNRSGSWDIGADEYIAAGGEEVSFSDTLSLSTSHSPLAFYNTSLSDSLSMGESSAPIANLVSQILSILNMEGSFASSAHLLSSTIDTLTLSDNANVTLHLSGSISDACLLSGNHSVVLHAVSSLLDVLSFTDSLTFQGNQSVSLSDILALNDNAVSYRNLISNPSDILGFAESILGRGHFAISKSDILSISEAMTSLLRLRASTIEAITFTDGFNLQNIAALIDSLILSESNLASIHFKVGLVDNLGLSDTMASLAAYAISIVDILGLTDSATINMLLAQGLVTVSFSGRMPTLIFSSKQPSITF